MYFIANWKMFGNSKSVNTLNKVIKFSKFNKNNKFKLIYCPPYTLLSAFSSKLKKTNIDTGAQNCHEHSDYGPFTGSINSKMIKNTGANYIIIGHSENRKNGESNSLINKKIKDALKNKLKVIFCIGETLVEKKNKKTYKILSTQVNLGLKNIKNFSNIIIAYEPVWAIGTGLIPKENDLSSILLFIKNLFKNRYQKVVYGGSVNSENIKILKNINSIDGFLIGGASQDSKKFIEIIKKMYT